MNGLYFTQENQKPMIKLLRSSIFAGIGCGFIMTTCVQFGRQGQYLPLLFGVPLFIVCGFPHCVADVFYFLCVPMAFVKAHLLQVLTLYVCVVLGNLVGCNLYRIVLEKDQY